MKTHLFYFKMNRENCFKTLNSTRYTQIRAQQKKDWYDKNRFNSKRTKFMKVKKRNNCVFI